MTQPQPGELVNIHISGAEVQTATPNQIVVRIGAGSPITIPRDNPAVTIEHAVPAGFPIQPGDVWKDSRGKDWFAHYATNGRGQREFRITSEDGEVHLDQESLLSGVGPLTLKYREAAEA